jgi:Xaa-Pro aminopeptidase
MQDQEKVGESFSLDRYLSVREDAVKVCDEIASFIKPGFTQEELTIKANTLLKERGFDKNWHMTHLRLGSDTLKKFRDKSIKDKVLTEDDIFFIDLGPVKDGYEADYGKTYVIGEDPEKVKIAKASEDLFHQVADHWGNNPLTGLELYDYAHKEAAKMGYELYLDVDGHRLGDFPHALFYRGSLRDFESVPVPNVWVFEVHLVHPSGEYGAFFEDILRKS